MIRVDTFIDLPKKAFPKNTIQNHIFPGDAVLWACTDGQSKQSGSSETDWHPGNETPQAPVPGSAGMTNYTSAKTQGLGWEGSLEYFGVSDPGKSHHPAPPESWSHQAQEGAIVWG